MKTPNYGEPPYIFILIFSLAVVSEILNASVRISDQVGITIGIGSAIAIAIVPFFGPMAAVLIIAAANFGIWFFKTRDETTWKKSWTQLLFNIGMQTIAIFLAGWVLQTMRAWFVPNSVSGAIASWLIAALVNDQVNLWLLIVILRLQHGQRAKPLNILRDNLWAMPINILTISVGGGLLAFSGQNFGVVGILVFFLPIILSSYAFQLYVRQMQAHMDNLEQIVANRTIELQKRTEELNLLVTEKDAFLAVLTHDMKSPLTSIGLYAELL